MSIRNFPESLSQAVLVEIILVGRLGVVWVNLTSERRHASIGALQGRCLSRNTLA